MLLSMARALADRPPGEHRYRKMDTLIQLRPRYALYLSKTIPVFFIIEYLKVKFVKEEDKSICCLNLNYTCALVHIFTYNCILKKTGVPHKRKLYTIKLFDNEILIHIEDNHKDWKTLSILLIVHKIII